MAAGGGIVTDDYRNEMKRSVVFIDTHDERIGEASGSLVDVNEIMQKPLLLTCHHVIPSKEAAKNCSVWFDCVSSKNPGTEVKGTDLFDLDMMFVTNENLNFTLIAIRPDKIPGAPRKTFSFTKHKKIQDSLQVDTNVTLLHYPYNKARDLYQNRAENSSKIVLISDKFLIHKAETLGGSGGCPVLYESNGEWVIVGLHSGEVENPKTKERAKRATVIKAINEVILGINLHEDNSKLGDIVDKYKSRFLSYVDAHAIARKLEIENVIPNRVSHTIENSAPEYAKDILFLNLRSHSSPETLHKLCDVMIGMKGYPNMNKLGRTMKEDLPSMTGEVFPGSLDIDPKETSSSRYFETKTSPPYMSKEFPNLTPSDVGLRGVLLRIPLWEDLAVSLGIPIAKVRAYSTDPLGGLKALQYWRDGRCGKSFPNTWRFLLEQVGAILGPLVAEDSRRKASTVLTWSYEPGKGKDKRAAQEDSLHTEVKTNHEEDLLRLCWIPFGLQTLTVDPESDNHTFLLQPNTVGCEKDDLIRLEVPKGAIKTDICKELNIRYGILVHGPFILEDNYELVSMVVYLHFNADHTTKPMILHLPHWASKEEATTVVFAPHELKGGYKFAKLNENLLPSTAMLSVPIYGHSSLFAKAIKLRSQKYFFAIPVESQKENVTTLSVYFTFASPVWCQIIDKYLIDDDHQRQSPQLCDLDENEIIPRLKEDKGAGWEANWTRTFKIISKHILYKSYGIRNKRQLEEAVCVLKIYPPYVECTVICTREAKQGGRPKVVEVSLRRSGVSDGGLRVTCQTYAQEPIGVPTPCPVEPIVPPLPNPTAPQPQEQQPICQVSGSQPESGPYRKVRARDVIAILEWNDLIEGIKDMLTSARVEALKRSSKLIDDDCANKIHQDLNRDPKGAATTLIMYFEKTHSGDELMNFCEFLREEAKEAGLAPALVDLAEKIEDAVKRTPSQGS